MNSRHEESRPTSDFNVVVRDADYDDVTAITSVLAAAFANDDPIGEYLFPDPDARARRQPKMFAAMIRYRFIPQGCASVAATDGRVVGALLWNRSDRRYRPIHALVGGIALVISMGRRVSAGIAIDTMFAELARGQPHVMGVYLGCAPEVQRRGVGRVLVNHLLAQCDRDRLPMYLVCKDANVNYYRDHGFDVVKRLGLGNDGPLVNAMVRRPRHP